MRGLESGMQVSGKKGNTKNNQQQTNLFYTQCAPAMIAVAMIALYLIRLGGKTARLYKKEGARRCQD